MIYVDMINRIKTRFDQSRVFVIQFNNVDKAQLKINAITNMINVIDVSIKDLTDCKAKLQKLAVQQQNLLKK